MTSRRTARCSGRTRASRPVQTAAWAAPRGAPLSAIVRRNRDLWLTVSSSPIEAQ